MSQPTLKLSHSQMVLKQKLQFLQDKRRADLISYDDDLVRHENQGLKQDLRVVKSIKTIKKKEPVKRTIRRGLSKGAISASQHQLQADPFELMMGASHNPLAASQHNSMIGHHHQASNLPEIKRKGTYYHRKFLEDVRPRDYKVYLNSLKTLQQYRVDETENKKLKDKLFREKMRLQNHIFQQHSKAAWGKVDQLSQLEKAKSMEPKKTTIVKPAQPSQPEPKKPIEKPANPQAPGAPQGVTGTAGAGGMNPGAPAQPGTTQGQPGKPATTQGVPPTNQGQQQPPKPAAGTNPPVKPATDVKPAGGSA